MIELPEKLVDCADAASALSLLCNGFLPRDVALAHVEPVPADGLPPDYAALLAHHDHMTKVLESHYAEPVRLEVVVAQKDIDHYARLIRLRLPRTRQIVEVGIARTNLRFVPPAVRHEILDRKAPLGDILIRHDVLRWIEPKWYLRFRSPSVVLSFFDPDTDIEETVRETRPSRSPQGSPQETYGRIGVINCAGQPAIELLEVVAPHA